MCSMPYDNSVVYVVDMHRDLAASILRQGLGRPLCVVSSICSAEITGF
jgi:hypothetical protein